MWPHRKNRKEIYGISQLEHYNGIPWLWNAYLIVVISFHLNFYSNVWLLLSCTYTSDAKTIFFEIAYTFYSYWNAMLVLVICFWRKLHKFRKNNAWIIYFFIYPVPTEIAIVEQENCYYKTFTEKNKIKILNKTRKNLK